MNKLKLTTAILTLTMALTAFAPSAMAIGVSPLRTQLKAQPGETVKGEIVAFNQKDQQQTVVLTKGDFLVNKNGDLDFYTEPDPQNIHSLMDWIELPEQEPIMEPKGKTQIEYTINVPEDAASQSYYGVVFVSAKNPEVIKTPAGVGVTTNVAQLVLLEVEGDLQSEISVFNFNIEKKDSMIQFITSVANEGNTHDAPTGKIIITDKKLNKLEEITFNDGEYNSLPNSPKTYIENLKNFDEINKGIYYAYLDMEDENGNEHAAELKFRKNSKDELEVLGLELGKSYGQALKDIGRYVWFPVIALCLAFVLILIAWIVKKTKK